MIMIKLDMHIHTVFARDGLINVADVIRVAKEKNFNAITITDHDSTRSHKVFRRYAEKYGFLFIPGVEVTTTRGDVLVYGVDKWNFPEFFFTPEELLDYVKANNYLAFPAHPFTFTGMGELAFKLGFDGVEIINAYSPDSSRRAIKYLQTHSYNGAKIGGSDAHVPEGIGRAYTIIYADDFTLESFLEALRKRATEIHGTPFSFFYSFLSKSFMIFKLAFVGRDMVSHALIPMLKRKLAKKMLLRKNKNYSVSRM